MPPTAPSLSRLRNMGIIAHIDAGKTTLSERVLFYSHVIHRMGEVHEGAATMDFMPEEQERGITIASACITCLWNEHTLNLVDTPGHVDFTIEVERSLRVLDGAVGVFCAVGGVEPQSETVWRQAEAFGIPRLAVVNKMDRPGANFEAVLESMRQRLNARPVAVTVPLGQGEEFSGILDVLRQERVLFDPADQGQTLTRTPFTAEEAALAAPWREALLDALTEEDDALLELCLAGETPPVQALVASLRAATLARRLVPVFAASALRNIGVQPVMDAICDLLPGPLESPPAKGFLVSAKEYLALGTAAKQQNAEKQGHARPVALAAEFERDGLEIQPDPKAPVCALVFKVLLETGRKIAFIRLYSGTLKEGDSLCNVTRGLDERVSRLFRIHAGRREQLKEAVAGDIVAAQGLKNVNTGDSLSDQQRLVLLENIRAYKPVISLAFEPRNAEEGNTLDEALANFCVEDPTLEVEISEATGQRIVSGMGELHLEILQDRMRREYSLSPRVGNPQVVCRETVGSQAEGTGEFDRELGGQQHYGQVRLRVAPAELGSGVHVAVQADTTGWQQPLLDAAVQGVTDACYSGPSGFQVEDVRIVITGLERKNGLATEPGCHMAGQAAMRAALEAAKSLVLEPIMDVIISVPEEFLGPSISLLGASGAKVESLEERAGLRQVQAKAPMRSLFGFATALRSATQGRAGLAMQFSHYGVQGA